MPSLRRLLALAALAVASVALLPTASAHAYVPSRDTLYDDGPTGRFLMGGDWLFKLDRAGVGERQRFQRQRSRAGWSTVKVPNAWNVGDDSPESMRGTIGWYRKDFTLPSAAKALDWAVRFESVNYRATVWLNGKPVGTNRGAYIPFEFRLADLQRRGTNRLVVRVDSRRRPTDFPPSGLTTTGAPSGGWWNYGGLLREVSLRRIDRVDWRSVRVTPNLPCATCAATVKVQASVRNATDRSLRTRLTGTFGGRRITLGSVTLGPGGVATKATTVRLAKPRLWTPATPNLYPVTLKVTGAGRTLAAYKLNTGVRSIEVSGDGHLLLNGQRVNLRGVGLHEDTREQGFAIDAAARRRIADEAKAVGATVIRTHYPMHPHMHELADRLGLLIWSEIPVYAVKTKYLALRSVRQTAAKELRKNIETFANHPSVMLWSISNELSSRPGPSQGDYIRRAVAQAKALDPTRPVGLAVASYPNVDCHAEYAPLDVIGVNEYFGWYPGPSGALFDRRGLSPFLDAVRACYPKKALMVTEFGAEANRNGPVEEKGTFEFQQDYVNYNLGVITSKPYLSGALYWALNEFRVRPGWDGGNPRPQSPVHQKGLLTYGSWARKPAWTDVERAFKATNQLAAP